MELVTPAMRHLESYVSALKVGWSPDNMRPDAGRDELALISADPAAFLASQTDRDRMADALGPPRPGGEGGGGRRPPRRRRRRGRGRASAAT